MLVKQDQYLETRIAKNKGYFEQILRVLTGKVMEQDQNSPEMGSLPAAIEGINDGCQVFDKMSSITSTQHLESGSDRDWSEEQKLELMITLDAPSFISVMQHARNRALREEVYRAYITRTSSGDLDNTPIINHILKLRLEKTKLLNYNNYVEVSMATKMAIVDKAEELLEKVQSASWNAVVQDFEDLKSFSKSQCAPEVDNLSHWDMTFWSDKLHSSGSLIAYFYFDPYSRPSEKRGGAWMDEVVSRSRVLSRNDTTSRLPISHMVCNQTPPFGDKPSLMIFREVKNVFHEFMLIKQDEGESLPEEVYLKLIAARIFCIGSLSLRQIKFASLDLELHTKYIPDRSEFVYDGDKRVSKKTQVIPPLSEDRFLCTFNHIFAGGYAAGYYNYKWAEVLSADAFSAFEDAGLENSKTVKEAGHKFRETILALGDGKDTQVILTRGFHGPLISAISVDPNFTPKHEEKKTKTFPIVIGVVGSVLVFLAFEILIWRYYFKAKSQREQDLKGRDLQTIFFTLKQIMAATNNFDSGNKIGEGRFGPVYRGQLADGTIIAVKQLSSKSSQGNREFLNEMDMISSRGLMFLHEETRLKTILETSQEPLLEVKDNINSTCSLSVEVAYINKKFSQQVLVRHGNKISFDELNPFANEDDEVASVVYRYRRWKLDIQLDARCEIQSVVDVNNQKFFLTLNALNEFDLKYFSIDWRQKLEIQRGAILATELKNNANKLAKWTAQVILANAKLMRLRHVSIVYLMDHFIHVILGVVGHKQ
ncbi:protein BRICK 1-like [Hibiscus syriacus]|uniref:Protein BRICK 1-like n=1 Tax=Hibiscus syriacus TaxID=106335 RepID=A0A6A2ZBS7_HIBSY|nr:protein BRICK 1-like [Hibiscus syriacus]